jgi:hypothetical protein
VDLGADVAITKIILVNRQGEDASRLNGQTVSVSTADDPGSSQGATTMPTEPLFWSKPTVGVIGGAFVFEFIL